MKQLKIIYTFETYQRWSFLFHKRTWHFYSFLPANLPKPTLLATQIATLGLPTSNWQFWQILIRMGGSPLNERCHVNHSLWNTLLFHMCFQLAKTDCWTTWQTKKVLFLSDDDIYHGVKCLVACDKVCSPKVAGGLGIKNIHAQSLCLMLKFAYKFLHSPNVPWKLWILQQSSCPIHFGDNASYVARIVHTILHSLPN